MGRTICIIDGQGGGIGATFVKYLKQAFGETVELIALGTNSIATSRMLKAGANKGADKGEIAQKVRATAVLLAKANEYLRDALRVLD